VATSGSNVTTPDELEPTDAENHRTTAGAQNDGSQRGAESDADGVQTRFTADDSPSEQIIQTVAQVKGVEPTALEPLYNVVDPDALDTLFADPHVFDENPVVATFTMAECRVRIHSDGTLAVRDTVEPE